MIAVADATPLCYLVLIGEIDLLPKLFSQVFVPGFVIAELLHEDAPEAVRKWASNLPSWICVEPTPDLASPGMEKTPVWRASGDSRRGVPQGRYHPAR